MVTKQQLLANPHAELHYGECTRKIGPRGGVTVKIEVWRRSGQVQTWKTRPNEFRAPIKWGLKTSSAVTQHNAGEFHFASDCPVLKAEDERRQVEAFEAEFAEQVEDRGADTVGGIPLTELEAAKPSILDPCPRCGGSYGLVNHSREECDKVRLQRNRVFTMKRSDIEKCPHFIMLPEHYRDDGSCRCNDSSHVEMQEWGYVWVPQDGRWL